MNEVLKEAKLDFSAYAPLPTKDDALLVSQINQKMELFDKWEKLHYIRKNLSLLDQYIQGNKGESLKQWLDANQKGMSKPVMDKLGKHNNDTGGISAYFLNLQNFYDEEEQQYDEMEGKLNVSPDVKERFESDRALRTEKRKTRRKVRKLMLKDMEKNDKGYLVVDIEEEPTPDEAKEENKNADGQTEEIKNEIQNIEKKLKKNNVGIWIAGTVLLIGVVYAASQSE